MINRRQASIALAASALMVARVRAQQPPPGKFRIGYLTPSTPTQTVPYSAFLQGMRDHGYVEGRNFVLEMRSADGHYERLPALAAELVRLPVDLIVVAGPIPVRAARDATSTVPIVMISGSIDPVRERLAASLARPGGNLTGLTYAVSEDRLGKQLELLKEVAPAVSRVAVWWDLQRALFDETWMTPLGKAASKLGLAIQEPVQVVEASGVEPAFAVMRRQRADALLVAIGGPTHRYRDRVAAEALRNRLPSVSAFREFTADGGLVSYGPDFADIGRRAAGYVDKILRGAKPGDLPIELPTRYQLAINTRTAKALGLTVPQSLLLRADEVVQ